MRCPKCSFISYDQVETCAKCGKNISAAAETLHGTTVNVPAPTFLQFEFEEPEPQYEQEAEMAETETADVAAEDEGFVDFSIEEDAEPEIDLGTDEIEMDIAEEEPAEEEAVFDLATEEPEVAEQEKESIDISDLTPTEEAEPEVEAVEEELGEGLVAEEEDHEGQGLEDLKVDIDLDTDESPKGKVMPSVKTGTALDDFDIDLGDLITGKKD